MVGNKAVPLLVAGMLVCGLSNSLFTKWQDTQCVVNCDSPDPRDHLEFSQPVWQTLTMFLGECLCLLPILYSAGVSRFRKRFMTRSQDHEIDHANGYQPLPQSPSIAERQVNDLSQAEAEVDHSSDRPDASNDVDTKAMLAFFAPAACDICGTTLMNVGLLFTPVSIYQMTRGALVLWVGIFSVIFLRRYLYMFQWLSLITVMAGVCIVGLSGTILKEASDTSAATNASFIAWLPALHPLTGNLSLPLSTETASILSSGPGTIFGDKKDHAGQDDEVPEAIAALFGVLLILFAQLFTASQFVLEEKIMSRYDIDPLLAVGCEGLFGFATTLTVMPLVHFFYGSTQSGQGGYFDMAAGWHQIINSQPVLWSSVAIAVSIALFNGCGLAVTRAISATARSTIDTCRTLGIWIASLILGWEVFRPLSGSLQTVGFMCLVYGTLVFNGILRPPKFLQPRSRRRDAAAGQERRARSRSRSRRNRSKSKSKSRQRSTEVDHSSSNQADQSLEPQRRSFEDA